MSEGEAVFDELRSEWEALVGSDRITDLQSALVRLLGAENTTVDDMTKDVPPA